MTKKKIIIIISAVVALLILALVLLWFFGPWSIPEGCGVMFLRCQTVKINYDDYSKYDPFAHGTFHFENSLVGSSVRRFDDYTAKTVIEDEWYIRYAAFILRTANYQKTDERPTDVQLVEISFSQGCTAYKFETYYFAYDFYKDKVFANKGGEWYLLGENKAINSLITQMLDYDLEYSTRWLGQSSFAHNESIESDFENQTFRYNLYWKSSHFPSVEDDEYRNSGFVNTKPSEIRGEEDAIALAAAEMGMTNPVASVFYDETCGYWMVEIFDNTENFDFSKLTDGISDVLFRNTYTVIMTDEGITLETYLGVTRFRGFISEADSN